MPLTTRDRRGEQMDDAGLDRETYRSVLADLARINRWTMAARPTLSFLARTTSPGEAIRLLDVGFGHGDMLRRIAGWARRRGVAAELIGIDLNPNSEVVARAATAPEMPIVYQTGDYRSVAGPFDFVISSLVAHHMSETELSDFIGFMEASATRGWLINDLHRHTLAWLGYPLLARGLGVHRIVRQDGTLSIARAFRPADWRTILRACSLGGEARIVRRFPFRLCVERLF
jgi:2-polyprenyl-3-methyl-5-hydroxy-6-metoxy-1,4-benzoquinol methylase